MTKYLIKDTTLAEIADAIRVSSGKSDPIFVADMATEILDISGTNFKVVGGTLEPENPTENMIWINTHATITSYIFSAKEPASPTEGMVWIFTGTSSIIEFNALKKNGIQVCPISAKQYISGAWVDKTAMSYQGGEWNSWWDGFLYKHGDQYEYITGGWESATNTNGKVVFEADYIRLYIGADTAMTSMVYTKDPIDVSNYEKMYVVISNVNITDSNGGVLCGFVSSKHDVAKAFSTVQGLMVSYTSVLHNNTDAQIVEVAIPNGGGLYYPEVFQYSSAVRIHQIYLQ